MSQVAEYVEAIETGEDPAAVLGRIAARASTLKERLEGRFRPIGGEALAHERLGRWLDRAANGDLQAFERRLGWLGQARGAADLPLGEVEPAGPLPEWTQVLAQVLAEAPGVATPLPSALAAHPFAELLVPFVDAALDRLAPEARAAFAPSALDDLAGDLMRTLSFFAGPTLYLEFAAFRSAEGDAGPASPAQTYRRFVRSRRLEPAALFTEYAALARLLSLAVLLWARNTTLLGRRLVEDSDAIAARFGDGRPPGRPVAVACTLSDRHKGGLTVAILTFESGLRLVYKPRDLSVETAFFKVLEALEDGGGHPGLRRLAVLERGGHGWVEVVQPAPCRDEADARRFYLRAGALLAVLYALEASDCFHENIIAAVDQPVLIDMETLMHHVLRRASDLGPAEAAAGDALFDSVFRAGFLPSWETSFKGVAVDISGLGARAGQPTPYVRRRWEAVNTDAMTLRYEPLAIESEIHLPRLDGEPLDVAAYADQLVEGFSAAYRRIMRLAQDGDGALQQALDQLGRSEIRLVFHATRIYALLQKRLFAPRHMRTGVDRSLELEVLSRFYVDTRAKAPFTPMLQAELEAMEDLDIPYFAVRADSQDLTPPNGSTIAGAFEQTAIERVRRRIGAFSIDDLMRQTEFIRASLSLSALNLAGQAQGHEGGEAAGPPSAGESAPAGRTRPEDLLAEARRIGQQIEQRAILSPDGAATWIAPQLLPGLGHYELRTLRLDLYAGSAGVALFFAAQQKVLNEGRAMALAALQPLRRFLAEADPARLMCEGYSLGAGTGAGSFVYSLARCADLLGEPALLEDAGRAAALITPELIAADETLDVLSGVAGAALALISLHARTGEADLLGAAALCGERLLERQTPMPAGAAWRTLHGKALAGMSHGAAGVALALARLGDATGEARFTRAARQAIAYEAWLFDAEAQAWPDLRKDEDQRPVMNAWCHGAVGIGLARLGGLQALGGAAAHADVDAALRAVLRATPAGKDGLCCGNLGRTALLAAGPTPRLAEAVDLAADVLARARRTGAYRLSGRPGAEFFAPGFFQGLSGIGYQLLGLGAPGQLPNILAWE